MEKMEGAGGMSGSVLTCWRATRRNAKACHSRVLGHYWRVVVGIRRFGYGKVFCIFISVLKFQVPDLAVYSSPA
jgi:hypothetical protein